MGHDMNKSFLSDTAATRKEIGRLFEEKPPVLVEVRFPNMGTAPDWFLCDDTAALEAVLDRAGPGVEIHLNSVWDLTSAPS